MGRNYLKPGAQFMSLGKECLQTSIVLHELLHSLGFWHEQSRPDRDKYVEIFWENIASSELKFDRVKKMIFNEDIPSSVSNSCKFNKLG